MDLLVSDKFKDLNSYNYSIITDVLSEASQHLNDVSNEFK